MLDSKKQPDYWLVLGAFAFICAVMAALVAYVSQPPASLYEAVGSVTAIRGNISTKHPKLNIFVSNGHEELRLYTDFGSLNRLPQLGDVVEAEYAADPFGRNFHRIWGLKDGSNVLMDKASSMASALLEDQQIYRFALVFFVFGVAICAWRMLIRKISSKTL